MVHVNVILDMLGQGALNAAKAILGTFVTNAETDIIWLTGFVMVKQCKQPNTRMIISKLFYSTEGNCDELGTDHRDLYGNCQCKVGFTGRQCEHCDTGYSGEECDICDSQLIKVQNGSCIEGQCDSYGAIERLADGTCHCEDGFGPPDCAKCKVGHYGEDCDMCEVGYNKIGSDCIGNVNFILLSHDWAFGDRF